MTATESQEDNSVLIVPSAILEYNYLPNHNLPSQNNSCTVGRANRMTAMESQEDNLVLIVLSSKPAYNYLPKGAQSAERGGSARRSGTRHKSNNPAHGGWGIENAR